MIITVNGKDILSYLYIQPSDAEVEQQKGIPNSIIVQDFTFVEPITLYEYVDGNIQLKANWEDLKEELRLASLPTFEELKVQKIADLHRAFDDDFEAYLAKYPKAEAESFKDKAKDAIAYILDDTAPTPYISSMTEGDETLRVALINAVWAKVQYRAMLEGQMIGKRDAIKACTTVEELEAIEI